MVLRTLAGDLMLFRAQVRNNKQGTRQKIYIFPEFPGEVLSGLHSTKTSI